MDTITDISESGENSSPDTDDGGSFSMPEVGDHDVSVQGPPSQWNPAEEKDFSYEDFNAGLGTGTAFEAAQDLDREMRETEAVVRLCQENDKVNDESDHWLSVSSPHVHPDTEIETASKNLDLDVSSLDEEIHKLKRGITQGFNVVGDSVRNRTNAASSAIQSLDDIMDTLLTHPGVSGNEGDFDKLASIQEEQVDQLLDVQTSYEYTFEQEMERSLSPIVSFSEDIQDASIGDLEGKRNPPSDFKTQAEWEEEVETLKTEIATLKIHALSSPPTPKKDLHAAEIQSLTSEAKFRSTQIDQLRKENVTLRNDLASAFAKKSKPSPSEKEKTSPYNVGKVPFEAKEHEYQKDIRSLKNQVRRLQKMLFTKDPNLIASINRATMASSREDLDSANTSVVSANDGNKVMGAGDCTCSHAHEITDREKDTQIALQEARIKDLEDSLAKADAEGQERLKDFQSKIQILRTHFDEQTTELELQLQESKSKINMMENSTAQSTIAELKLKNDRAQTEINSLKHEISRHKRELEIAQKTVTPVHTKQDAGTLSLAIKSFKSELAEKDREIMKYKKEIADLNKTNTNLKREREKYLAGGVNQHGHGFSQTSGGHVGQRGGRGVQATTGAKADIPKRALSASKSQRTEKPVKNSHSPAAMDVLQSTLDYERAEFEQILRKKKKDVEDRDKTIDELKRQIMELETKVIKLSSVPENKDKSILEELRSRVERQNQVILKLQEPLNRLQHLETEYSRLQCENRQLFQKLEVAEAMARPENEILSLLAEKYDQLNARYLLKEQQMETLLNRLSLQVNSGVSNSGLMSSYTNTADPLSPRARSGLNLELMRQKVGIGQLLAALGASSRSPTSASPTSGLDFNQLSPTLSLQLLAANLDLPPA